MLKCHFLYKIGVCYLYFFFIEDKGSFEIIKKNPEISWEYVFLLIPGVGYGAASDCPQQETMICLVL